MAEHGFIRGVGMGDFEGGIGIRHLDGRCWVCGKLVTRGKHYCNGCKSLGRKARADVHRLLAYARRKRGRRLVRDWWEADSQC